MTLAGIVCRGVGFWWMHRFSTTQNILLDPLQEQGKRIKNSSHIKHDRIQEVHPQANEIMEGIEEMIAVVSESNLPPGERKRALAG